MIAYDSHNFVIIEQWIVHAFVPNYIKDVCLAAGRVGALAGVSRHGLWLCDRGEAGGRLVLGLPAITDLRLPWTSITFRRAACRHPLLLSASRLER